MTDPNNIHAEDEHWIVELRGVTVLRVEASQAGLTRIHVRRVGDCPAVLRFAPEKMRLDA